MLRVLSTRTSTIMSGRKTASSRDNSLRSSSSSASSSKVRSVPNAGVFFLDSLFVAGGLFTASLFSLAVGLAGIGAVGWLLSQLKFVRDFVKSLYDNFVMEKPENS